MPNLTLKPGIIALELSTDARAVLSLLVERYLKGPNDEGETNLKLSVLAARAGLSTAGMERALFELHEAKVFTFDTELLEDAATMRIDSIRLYGTPERNLLNTAEDCVERQFALGKADRLRCGSEWADMPDGKLAATVSAEGEQFLLDVVRPGSDQETGQATRLPVFSGLFETPEAAWHEWDQITKDAVRPDGPAQLELHTNGHVETGEAWLDKPSHAGTWDRKWDDEAGAPAIERMDVSLKGRQLLARPEGSVVDPTPIRHWGGAWKLVVEEAKVEAVVV